MVSRRGGRRENTEKNSGWSMLREKYFTDANTSGTNDNPFLLGDIIADITKKVYRKVEEMLYQMYP